MMWIDEPATGSVFHDARKRLRVQRGAANQCAVNFGLRHQSLDVLRLYRPAIQNAQVVGQFLSKGFGSFTTDQGVGLGSKLGCGGLAGSNGPNGFVGDD